MGNRWFYVLAIFVGVSAAGCTEAAKNENMYQIDKVDFAAQDSYVPDGMKPIGSNSFPHVSLLGRRPANAPDYIFLSRATKLARYEDGHWSTPDLRDFKTGMYMKIPAETETFLTFPGQRYPYSIILSSKPIPAGALPESDVAGHVNAAMLQVVSRIPGTESVVKEMADPISAMKPDKRFSAHSCDTRITRVREMRFHKSEELTKMSPEPFSENQLMGIRLTAENSVGAQNKRYKQDIFVDENTKVSRVVNGKLMPGRIAEINKGMFVRFTTYSDHQEPTWLVFSDAEIPSTVHDPRIAD